MNCAKMRPLKSAVSAWKRAGSILIASLILASALGTGGFSAPGSTNMVQAESAATTSTPPVRQATLNVSYTLYTWWLIRWNDNQVMCQIQVEQDGLPNSEEIETACGSDLAAQWLATPACTLSESTPNPAKCSGFYLHLVNSKAEEHTMTVDVDPPSVGVTLVDCGLSNEKDYCTQLPSLKLTGVEPLPNETIIQIQGVMNGKAFSCAGDSCTLPLAATDMAGITVTFWAQSSFGDSSDHYTALVRVIPWADFTAADKNADDEPRWFVDVISSQWEGEPLAGCAEIWSALPPIGGTPNWLSTPSEASQLSSFNSYYFLAGSLIKSRQVDAQDCPNDGLDAQGVATPCGLQKAMSAVLAWQNQFNEQIVQVANATNVPAQLMKNFFSRESQFWPGIFQTVDESGFGQLTENGADTTLLWNNDFFNQFCPLVFKSAYCKGGYNTLTNDQQKLLQGALLQKVNATCKNCADGIDLTRANASIKVFANSLLANCTQVGQIIYNLAHAQAGTKSSYEDLWKFTLVNYNAGAGCLTSAIQTSLQQSQPLTWSNVSSHLEPACQGAIQYVQDISQEAGP